MKRYTISTIVVLAILVVAWTAFGQEEESAEQRQQRMENMRQRFENMSEEEREEFRARMRERFSLSPEKQQKFIKVIEEQLPKLKAALRPEGGRENARKLAQERQKALETIILQVAKLRGWRQTEGERLFIVSNTNLKSIQEAATKEKAKETSELLERLIAREGRGFGQGRRSERERPQSDQQR